MNCIICFENSLQGLSCKGPKSHFLCSDCLPPLVISLCNDLGKLKDSKFRICCQDPDCRESYTSKEVTICLNSQKSNDGIEAITTLISTLTRAAQNSQQREDKPSKQNITSFNERLLKDILADSLCLKCPTETCGRILDPNPDGCSAMRCVGCGTYFCWICFNVCQTNDETHTHVRNCPQNPRQGNLFVKNNELSQIRKPMLLRNIKSEFIKHYGPQWSYNLDILRCLLSNQGILQGTNISFEDLTPLKPSEITKINSVQTILSLAKQNTLLLILFFLGILLSMLLSFYLPSFQTCFSYFWSLKFTSICSILFSFGLLLYQIQIFRINRSNNITNKNYKINIVPTTIFTLAFLLYFFYLQYPLLANYLFKNIVQPAISYGILGVNHISRTIILILGNCLTFSTKTLIPLALIGFKETLNSLIFLIYFSGYYLSLFVSSLFQSVYVILMMLWSSMVSLVGFLFPLILNFLMWIAQSLMIIIPFVLRLFFTFCQQIIHGIYFTILSIF